MEKNNLETFLNSHNSLNSGGNVEHNLLNTRMNFENWMEMRVGFLNCKGLEGNYFYVIHAASKCDILLVVETWKEKWSGLELRTLEKMDKLIYGQAAKKNARRGRPSKGQVWILSKGI